MPNLSTLAPLLAALPIATALPLTGCTGKPSPDTANYTLVYLTTGPTSPTNTREQKQQIFAGHMANMQRLADDGTLIIAGPFSKPTNPAWRGIFLFDVPDTAKATALASTDPGVVAGEFATTILPARGTPALRTLPALDKAARQRAGTTPPAPGQPPANIRPYVMVTAENFDRAAAAIAKPGTPRVLWRVRFGPPRDGAGLFVLDASSTDAARAALDQSELGPVTIDTWFSTTAVAELPSP
jgi:uncharacterized protein YciI